jgi:hypothetical protein
MTVMVSANERVPLNVIFDFVRSKASWIIKNTGYFSDAQPSLMADWKEARECWMKK